MSRTRKTQQDNTIFHMYGKVPPQAKDLEAAVLGAIMLERGAIDIVADILKPEVFYVEAHQRIYSAIVDLNSRSQPIDILTVVEQLLKQKELDNVGGALYVTKLTNSVVSAANIEAHARIMLQKYVQRELIRVGGELVTDGYDDSSDVFEMLDKAEERLISVTNLIHKRNFYTTDQLLVQAVTRIEHLRTQDGKMTGVPSGFANIDRLTHGWQNEDLIILAARPSVGKTAFALNLARNAALSKAKPTPVAFFSLEMSAAQLMERLISAESEIHLNKIKTGRIEESEMKVIYNKGIQALADMPLYIDDQGALNIFELRAKIRRLKSKKGVGLVILDYLQLMSGTGGRNTNREQEIAEISRGLKGLAKELGIPIIALSQLSRAVETRSGEKMPQLSDLRESGALEQDADVVMFLYRPDYYGKVRDEMGESSIGETHVRFAKHRNGSLDTVKLQARLWIQKFVEMENTPLLPSEVAAGGELQGEKMWRPVSGIDFKSRAAGEESSF